METVAVFKLPASPNIVRAGCREPQIPLLFPDYKLLPKQYPPIEYPLLMPRAWPPLTWYNFFSNYLWHFNISLFNFFPNIFFDIRYGFIPFRTDTPDHDEITYDATELKLDIAGTEYTYTWAVTPVAEFSADVTNGDEPLTVTFTDESTNTPVTWSWSFGDTSTSTDQHPSNEYARGLFTVALTASNDGGSDTETKTDYILVRQNHSYGYDSECHVIIHDEWEDPMPPALTGWANTYWNALKTRFATQDFDTYTKDTLTEDDTPNLGWKWYYRETGSTFANYCEDSDGLYPHYGETKIESNTSISVADTENAAINSISVTLTADSARVKDKLGNWEDYATTISYTVYLHKFDNYPPTTAELNALADLLTEEDFTGMNSIHTDSITTDSNGNGSDSYEITGISSAYCGTSTAIILHLDEVRTYDATIHYQEVYTECSEASARRIESRGRGDSLEISGTCTIT